MPQTTRMLTGKLSGDNSPSLRDVVTALDGQLQVIVCDHANLADDWFQEAVIGNWRNGIALIPDDWLSEK
jgi:hypothetical protein